MTESQRAGGRSRLLLWGAFTMLVGCLLAYRIQTSGGIRILDIRFAGTAGTPMSALLYIPPNATPKTPAPGILAVHGYINSREVQDGFAIEFARRGYVVLAMDQTGHGRSAPPAFANRFGGPDGLHYLRGLNIVDKDNIGLEGHSMGGWTVLGAAAAIPDGYHAVVLEGSSTGAPFAPEGTATSPRNLAVVFSRFDEFSQIMWGVPTAAEVANSKKLQTVFGTDQPVEPGKLYGTLDNGTGRMLYTPGGTHPWDHISPTAIGHSIDWFQKTLKGGTPKPSTDQIWYWKEIGTLIGFIGFVVFLLGAFDMLIALPYFSPLLATPIASDNRRNARWWIVLAIGALVPALTLLPFFEIGGRWVSASRLLPQSITNEIVTWAVLNALIVAILSLLPGSRSTRFNVQVRRSIVIALLTVGFGYLATAAADFFFKVDFRIWFVAVKLMTPEQVATSLMYLVPFTLFFVLVLRALHTNLFISTDKPALQYLTNCTALVGGFIVFHIVQYGSLFTTHHLVGFFANDTLRTIVAIQFVPLMLIVAWISTFAYRRTNSYLPGALVCALLVTWYVVAGQATHVAS